MGMMAGLHSYQIDLYLKLASSGYKKGEKFFYYTSGRGVGKSYLNHLYNQNLCQEIVMPSAPKSKYKFSRAKWYTVELQDMPWRFSREYNEIIAWCSQQFGAHPVEADAWSRWHVGLSKIYFRDAKDYQWYMLRWA